MDIDLVLPNNSGNNEYFIQHKTDHKIVTSKKNMLDLPIEIILNILKFLPERDLTLVSLVNKSLYRNSITVISMRNTQKVLSKSIKKIKVLSLFSGAGGLDLGFVRAGMDIVLANDIDKYACETYKKNLVHCQI